MHISQHAKKARYLIERLGKEFLSLSGVRPVAASIYLYSNRGTPVEEVADICSGALQYDYFHEGYRCTQLSNSECLRRRGSSPLVSFEDYVQLRHIYGEKWLSLGLNDFFALRSPTQNHQAQIADLITKAFEKFLNIRGIYGRNTGPWLVFLDHPMFD